MVSPFLSKIRRKYVWSYCSMPHIVCSGWFSSFRLVVFDRLVTCLHLSVLVVCRVFLFGFGRPPRFSFVCSRNGRYGYFFVGWCLFWCVILARCYLSAQLHLFASSPDIFWPWRFLLSQLCVCWSISMSCWWSTSLLDPLLLPNTASAISLMFRTNKLLCLPSRVRVVQLWNLSVYDFSVSSWCVFVFILPLRVVVYALLRHFPIFKRSFSTTKICSIPTSVHLYLRSSSRDELHAPFTGADVFNVIIDGAICMSVFINTVIKGWKIPIKLAGCF